MLHNMCLVSSKHYNKLTATKKPISKIKRKLPQSDFHKWIKMSVKLREEDFTCKAQLKDFAKFVKEVLPEPPVQRFQGISPTLRQRESLQSAVIEITPKKPKLEIYEDAES